MSGAAHAPVLAVIATLSCRDLDASVEWYQHLFGRPPTAHPGEGVVEWHFGESAGVQLRANAGLAGQGRLTLVVADIRADAARLGIAGATEAGAARLLQLRDPDDNLVVLAQAV